MDAYIGGMHKRRPPHFLNFLIPPPLSLRQFGALDPSLLCGHHIWMPTNILPLHEAELDIGVVRIRPSPNQSLARSPLSTSSSSSSGFRDSCHDILF